MKRALVICVVSELCACLPGDFDQLARSLKQRRDASAERDGGGLEEADSAPPGEDAAPEPPLDAAAEAGASGVEDAAERELEAGLEAGPSDAMAQDAPNAPSCAPPRTLCDERCVDPRSDSAHCGDCGTACAPGYACVQRSCVSESGCSDNTREGFLDQRAFPGIAGCSAAWPMASMRARRVLSVCGNSAGMCTVPADACGLGWHVCGHAADGPADVTSRVTSTECNATPGRWAGALGDISCEDCSSPATSGAICCGADCVQQNNDCLWPGETAWFGVVDGFVNLCTGTENPELYASVGVLCCRDDGPLDRGAR